MVFQLSDLPPKMQKKILMEWDKEDKEKQAMLEAKQEDKKRSKYRSEKITVELPDGSLHTFDSRKEARRYEELLVRLKAGEISDLRLQVKFVLIPAQYEPDTIGKRGGVKKGKLIERECSYYADFAYIEDGKQVVEDVKSPITRTPVYKVKKKLMLYVHGIRLKEV